MSHISILNHSSSSVCQKKKKKNGRRRMYMEGFNEGLSTILTCSNVWLRVCVGVRVWERDQEGVCGHWHAHRFVQCVCIDVWMTARVWEAYCKHAAPDSSVRAAIVCMPVCVHSMCVHVCVLSVRVCFSICPYHFLSQSCCSTFIPLVGLYPVLLCLWI